MQIYWEGIIPLGDWLLRNLFQTNPSPIKITYPIHWEGRTERKLRQTITLSLPVRDQLCETEFVLDVRAVNCSNEGLAQVELVDLRGKGEQELHQSVKDSFT